MRQRDMLLEELNDQKDDVYDLADIPVDNQSSEQIQQSSNLTSRDEGGDTQSGVNDSSLVNDFANSSQEMPSYMDPED
jgi:hypothetical protein